MATSGKFEMSGLEEWIAELEQAEKDVDGSVRDALFEAAQTVQEAMQDRVPVLTGRLWMHIKIDGPHTIGNYSWCEVGVIHDRNFTPKDVAIQANVIEYGTTGREARPFVRPAFRVNKNALINAMKKIRDKYGLT